jgi:hypothetical protein
MKSPYQGKAEDKWLNITRKLVNKHPLKDEIVETVLQSWEDIFNSKMGSFFIGKEIFPEPQIMSFFLHELVAHNLSLKHPGVYKVGEPKKEKDIHNMVDPSLGIEIKASSHKDKIFANRSYAQPSSGSETKDKNGYYIAINFEKFSEKVKRPKITLIRFGYLEHKDWIPQKASTGQQAHLSSQAYELKLITLFQAE